MPNKIPNYDLFLGIGSVKTIGYCEATFQFWNMKLLVSEKRPFRKNLSKNCPIWRNNLDTIYG